MAMDILLQVAALSALSALAGTVTLLAWSFCLFISPLVLLIFGFRGLANIWVSWLAAAFFWVMWTRDTIWVSLALLCSRVFAARKPENRVKSQSRGTTSAQRDRELQEFQKRSRRDSLGHARYTPRSRSMNSSVSSIQLSDTDVLRPSHMVTPGMVGASMYNSTIEPDDDNEALYMARHFRGRIQDSPRTYGYDGSSTGASRIKSRRSSRDQSPAVPRTPTWPGPSTESTPRQTPTRSPSFNFGDESPVSSMVFNGSNDFASNVRQRPDPIATASHRRNLSSLSTTSLTSVPEDRSIDSERPRRHKRSRTGG